MTKTLASTLLAGAFTAALAGSAFACPMSKDTSASLTGGSNQQTAQNSSSSSTTK